MNIKVAVGADDDAPSSSASSSPEGSAGCGRKVRTRPRSGVRSDQNDSASQDETFPASVHRRNVAAISRTSARWAVS